MSAIVTSDDVIQAAARLAGQAVQTPLLRNAYLDELTGCKVLVKPECLQVAGAFKFRGAYNRMAQLDVQERSRGVVAWSSGNHAQGVAAAASRLGVAATIVMPADAPVIKLENTRRWGADVVLFDRYREQREAIAADLMNRTGALPVPPYNHPQVIAGQGTVGLEIARQSQAAQQSPDVVLVPCGGGGLVAGCALGLVAGGSKAAVFSVEPEGFDDTARSLASGQRERNAPEARSICDALMAPTPGELTWTLNRRLLAGGLAVSEAEVVRAMVFAWRELKLVVEPGGAVALAALLAGRVPRGRCVAIVLSGGNADPAAFAGWLGS